MQHVTNMAIRASTSEEEMADKELVTILANFLLSDDESTKVYTRSCLDFIQNLPVPYPHTQFNVQLWIDHFGVHNATSGVSCICRKKTIGSRGVDEICSCI